MMFGPPTALDRPPHSAFFFGSLRLFPTDTLNPFILWVQQSTLFTTITVETGSYIYNIKNNVAKD